jgi:hypothetical protein
MRTVGRALRGATTMMRTIVHPAAVAAVAVAMAAGSATQKATHALPSGAGMRTVGRALRGATTMMRTIVHPAAADAAAVTGAGSAIPKATRKRLAIARVEAVGLAG